MTSDLIFVDMSKNCCRGTYSKLGVAVCFNYGNIYDSRWGLGRFGHKGLRVNT